MADPRVRVTVEGDKPFTTSLRLFLEHNREGLSPKEKRWLREGETVLIGGGAAPFVTVERVGRKSSIVRQER
jgi:hypothetical protein